MCFNYKLFADNDPMGHELLVDRQLYPIHGPGSCPYVKEDITTVERLWSATHGQWPLLIVFEPKTSSTQWWQVRFNEQYDIHRKFINMI